MHEADGSWRKDGEPRGNTGVGAGMTFSLSDLAALGAPSSQMLTFISAFLWSTGPYYSCFIREGRNGIYSSSWTWTYKERQCPDRVLGEETPTLPHPCPAVVSRKIKPSLQHFPNLYQNQSSLEQTGLDLGP